MTKKKNNYYAVARGRKTGIFKAWGGIHGAEQHVIAFPNANYKGFKSLNEARMWLKENEEPQTMTLEADNSADKSTQVDEQDDTNSKELKRVTIYTDGGAIRNPGPGGYGVVMIYGSHRKEFSGGFRRTTNNRMELMACIVGLKSLKYKCNVVVHSDSRYVVDGISKGWARRWRANNWLRNKTEPAENADLWSQLLTLCEMHKVQFQWVKGHAGNTYNERCDTLATKSAMEKELPADVPYESNRTTSLIMLDI